MVADRPMRRIIARRSGFPAHNSNEVEYKTKQSSIRGSIGGWVDTILASEAVLEPVLKAGVVGWRQC